MVAEVAAGGSVVNEGGGGRGRGGGEKEDDKAKGESRKHSGGSFETKASVNLHPDIWSTLSDDAKAQIAAARRDIVRLAKAARTDGDSSNNKDASSPYLLTNHPTYVEGDQPAASCEPAAAAQPAKSVKFSQEGKTPSAAQSEVAETSTPKGAGFRFGRRSTVPDDEL